MSYMPVGKIFKDSDSIFKLTIIAARRAVELNNGANKLINTSTAKFSTIALEEIAAGKVKYKILTVKRAEGNEHWQLPQGGTDGESLMIAGARELKEELNTKNFKAIAVFKNLFTYKFNLRLDRDGLPTEYQPMKNQRGYKGQRQSLLIAEFMGQDDEIKVNYWEHAGWRWVEAEKLVVEVYSTRQEATKIFMEKFWETVN